MEGGRLGARRYVVEGLAHTTVVIILQQMGVYVYQVNMCSLNLQDAVCQLYLNKAGENSQKIDVQIYQDFSKINKI